VKNLYQKKALEEEEMFKNKFLEYENLKEKMKNLDKIGKKSLKEKEEKNLEKNS